MRLVVLASGNGTNLQAVIDATGLPGLRIVAVFSDKPAAYALERARVAGIPALLLPCEKGTPRAAYDASLADAVSEFDPDYIFLLGWMRILTDSFLTRFAGKVINLHPALPGTFAGTHAIERALEAYRSGTIDRTGVMTHYVPDEGVDCGPVLRVAEVPILAGDTLETLEERVHETEPRVVLETLEAMQYKIKKTARQL